MSVGTKGPKPGAPCVYCSGPIHSTHRWVGGKNDYWHEVCYRNNAQDQMLEKYASKPMPQGRPYGDLVKFEEYAHDDGFEYVEEEYKDPIPYNSGNPDYKTGYNLGYEHGERDGAQHAERSIKNELDSVRAILDIKGVPASASEYGPGQAGRLSWFLDRNGYVIHEIGNPDALQEG